MSKHTSSAAQYKRLIATAVASHGFAVIPVGYGECSIPGCCCPPSKQPWTYTVGLVDHGQPELVLLGLDSVSAHEEITWVVDRAKHGFSLSRNEIVDDVKLVDVPFDWLATDPNRMALWFEYYESGRFELHAPDVRQLVWPDEDGRFPDDPLCDLTVVASQPILNLDPLTYPQANKPYRNPARHQKRQRR